MYALNSLNVGPNDVLLVHLNTKDLVQSRIDTKTAKIKDDLHEVFPNNKVVVLESDVSMTVISREISV
jgi:hypothetical protein